MSDLRDGVGISFATWQDRQLAAILNEIRSAHAAVDGHKEKVVQELGKLVTLLSEFTRREDELRADTRLWQDKAADLDRQLKEQTALRADLQIAQQRLEAEVARLRQLEKNYAEENQTLSSRASAANFEATNLRRLVTELHNSLSWKITAPLRMITKPIFERLHPTQPNVVTSPTVGTSPTAPPAPPKPTGTIDVFPTPSQTTSGPVDAILPELRHATSIAIIPCAIPFSSTLNQRPISCARYLADHGTTVLYVAWQWLPEEEVPQAWKEVYPRVFHIPLYGFQGNVEAIAAASYGKGAYLSTLPSPGLVDVVRPLRAAGYHIHYDIMDDWEGFHKGGEAPWFSAPVEHEMVILADTVTAVSDRLAEKFSHLRTDIAVVRNGYQPAALASEQFVAAHAPLSEKKTIGYFGHFSDAWFDWDTVLYAAGKRPDVEFELIGWGISEPTRMRIEKLPNIKPIGIVPQAELHKYARNWWGGMIPFQPTDVSAAVDPLKVYEYLHLGLPSIVTGISGIAKYPLVDYAENRDRFVDAIDRITSRPNAQLLAEVERFLKDCTWDERFAKLKAMLEAPAGLAFLYAKR